MKKLYLLLFSIFTLLIPIAGVDAADAPTGTVDAITNYTDLPFIAKGHEAPVTITFDSNTKKYTLLFDFKAEKLKFETPELPHFQNKEFAKTFEGVMPRKAWYYSTTEKQSQGGDRIFWYDFQNNPATGEILAEQAKDKDVVGFRPFVVYNIDKSKLEITDKLLLFGKTILQRDSIYFDIAFPMQLDDLLQITMSYDVQAEYFWGIPGKKNRIITKPRVLNHKEAKYAWWQYMLAANVFDLGGMIMNSGDTDHITNVTSKYSTTSARESFVNDINTFLGDKKLTQVTTDEVFKSEYSVYRVYGSTVKGLGQTGLRVSDVSVNEVLYVYHGEYFFVPQEDITSIITDAMNGDSLSNLNLGTNEYLILLAVVAMVVMQLVAPILNDKKLLRFLLFVAAAVGVAYVFLR